MSNKTPTTSHMLRGHKGLTSTNSMGGGSDKTGATSDMVENTINKQSIKGMIVGELRKLAKAKGIRRYRKLRKAELINALTSKGGKSVRETKKALKGYVRSFEVSLKNMVSPIDQLSRTRGTLLRKVVVLLESMRGHKVNETLEILFSKKTEGPSGKAMIINDKAYINSGAKEVTKVEDIEGVLKSTMETILSIVDTWVSRGSGWVVDSISNHYLNIAKYSPLNGSSYIELAIELRNSLKGLVNIQNDDDECFRWCHVRVLKPETSHVRRVKETDREFAKKLDYTDVEFLVSRKHYNKVERQNEIRVNVFGYESKQPFPIYLSKESYEKVMNLLLITKDDKRHYVLIKDFNKFMYNQTKHKCRMHFCMHCLQCFSTEEVLRKHTSECTVINGSQSVRMPEEGKDYVRFENHHRRLQVPFVIYADFEAITQKVHGCKKSMDRSYTEAYQNHIDCGYGYKVVCCYDDKYTKDVKLYRGEGSVKRFLEDMLLEVESCKKVIKECFNKEIIMTPNYIKDFEQSKSCYICGVTYKSKDTRVRDHCHVTGRYT